MASKKTLISTSALVAVLALPLFALGTQAQPAPGATQTEQAAPDAAPDDAKKGRHGHRGKMIDRIFSEFDTNGDGSVERAEFDKVRDERFAAVDANKDGKIDRDEFRQHRREMRQEWRAKRMDWMTKRLDTDKDGSVSEDEFLAGPKKRFEKLDTNSDGKIDSAEMKASVEKMQERMEKRMERFKERRAEKGGEDSKGGDREARRGHHHGFHGRHHGFRSGKMFNKLDTNDDKAVSREEFDKGLDKVFDTADANKDGKVERSEVESAVSLWHQKHDKDRD